MSFSAKCPCGANLKAPDGSLGKRGRCLVCGASFPILPWLMCTVCGDDIVLDADALFVCSCKKAPYGPRAFTGPPGNTWANTTGVVRYQLASAFHDRCGPCFQYSGHIGNSWPIPFVQGCVCSHRVLLPGETSDPFPDFNAAVAALTPEQQDLVMGRDNWTLFRAGLAAWSDIVLHRRVRDFEQVMAVKRLAFEDMVRAGVPEATVRAAWDSVYTPERLANDARRKELVAKLKAAGMSREDVVRAVTERHAARIVGPRKSGPSAGPGE